MSKANSTRCWRNCWIDVLGTKKPSCLSNQASFVTL